MMDSETLRHVAARLPLRFGCPDLLGVLVKPTAPGTLPLAFTFADAPEEVGVQLVDAGLARNVQRFVWEKTALAFSDDPALSTVEQRDGADARRQLIDASHRRF